MYKKKQQKVQNATLTRADSWIVLSSLCILTLLSSMSKFGLFGMDGNVESGSLASQILWGSVYLIAARRVIDLRSDSTRLARRTIPLIAFIVIIFLSCLWSVNQWTTLRNAIEMAGTMTVCYYMVTRFTRADLLRILIRYFSGVSLTSALLIFLWPSHGRSSYGVIGWCGLFEEKNGFGAAMGLAILTYVAGFAYAESKRDKIVLALNLFLSLFLFAGAQSTTAAIVLVATATIVLIIVGSSARVYGPLVAMGAGLGVALTAIFFLNAGIDSSTFFEAIGKSPTLTGRTEFWPGILRAIGDRPILGFGYNAFFFTQSTVQEYIAGLTGWWIPLTAHNSYYQILLSVGFLGLIIFVLAVIPAIATSFMQITRYKRNGAAWSLAIIFYSLFGSFTEVYIGIPNGINSICFLLAILLAMSPKVAEESSFDVPSITIAPRKFYKSPAPARVGSRA